MDGKDTFLIRERQLFQKILEFPHNGMPLAQLAIFNDAAAVHALGISVLKGDCVAYVRAGSWESYARSLDSRNRAAYSMYVVIAITVSAIAIIRAIIRRPQVLVYSVDKVSSKKFGADARIESVYEALSSSHTSYIEVFHTLLGKSFISNLLVRRRPAVYLEAIDALWYAGQWMGLYPKPKFLKRGDFASDDEMFIARTAASVVANASLVAFRTRWILRIMRTAGIKKVITVDDARTYQCVTEAARLEGIPSAAVQHGGGHFTMRWPGWNSDPAYDGLRYLRAGTYFVWSDYWMNKHLHLGGVYPADHITVAGYPTLKPISFKVRAVDDNELTVLVPYETDVPMHKVAPIINELSKSPDVRVYFKCRTDVPVDYQKSMYAGVDWNSVSVIQTYDEVPRPTLVLGVYSTVLYDLAREGIAVGRFDVKMDYGASLVDEGLAGVVRAGTAHDDAEEILTHWKVSGEKWVAALSSNLRMSDTLVKYVQE